MSAQVREYRFATAAHWALGLCSGFDIGSDGSLDPIPHMGNRATRVTDSQEATFVAVAAEGVPYWRARDRDSGAAVVRWLVPPDETSLGFDTGGALAVSSRWAMDSAHIWAFIPGTSTVTRLCRASLDAAMVIDLIPMVSAATEREVKSLVITDLASDGCHGVWVLAADLIIRLDENGRCVEVFDVPAGSGVAQQLGALSTENALVVLTGGGKYLLFLEAATGTKKRLVPLSSFAPYWTCLRLSTDGRHRIALIGHSNSACRSTDGSPQGQLYVLDSGGDLVDGPLTNLFADDTPAGTDTSAIDFVHDLAIHRDAIWLATARGLWRLDSGSSSDSLTSADHFADSQFLTPLLLSPESERGRGWLRAEIDIDLPDGALIEAQFAGTDDARVASTLESIFADATHSVAARVASVWSTFAAADIKTCRFSGPQPLATPIAIPLFELNKRWLVLGISLLVPPGVASPAIRQLTVRYPDLSIEQYLPEIFRGEQNDPNGFLRRIAGVLETTTQDLDSCIRSAGRSLDPRTAAGGMLDYIASWIDLPWDEALPEAAKRRLLNDSANIIAQRGTRSGLDAFLRALLGSAGQIEISDPTGEFSLIRLGGQACAGIRLPGLLAGTRVGTPTLGAKAVLGVARLPCKGAQAAIPDPLASLAPSLTINIATDASTMKTLAKLLDNLLRAYLPAGLQRRVIWTVRPNAPQPGDGALVLDENGPGMLGSDSLIGRTVISGESGGSRLDCGLRVGFILQ